jgi:enolase
MVDSKITKIKSRWILDSRGNPTVETDVYVGENLVERLFLLELQPEEVKL